MGSTGACAEVVSLTIERRLEPDSEPMTIEEMAERFETTTEPVSEQASANINLRGSDAFAV